MEKKWLEVNMAYFEASFYYLPEDAKLAFRLRIDCMSCCI
jgi:hypothetical protein